ncbi:MAG: TRAP transporter large permease subunit [Hyphomicrobiaceae bacterium]|nr:TRAP transporter large permease subunit [Hyphomicrobiaceae bacterium]
MAEFIAHNMAPIMFASLMLFLILGYPVAFSLAALGLFYFIVGVELAPISKGQISLDWNLLGTLPDRFFGGVMANETLLAIPFFTFMGLILERSGMAEKLLDTVGRMFGPVRGGLAYAVIFVGALLAATTGVVAASVIAMGLISLPIMLRYGYDRKLASGVIAASGTLAQIIPPSLVLIVLADQLGRSVGMMYQGALVPGLVLTGFYAIYVLIMTIIFPKSAPALPPEARTFGEGAPYGRVMIAVLPSILLVVWAMVVMFDPDLGTAPVKGILGSIGEGALELVTLAACAVLFVLYYMILKARSQPIAHAVWRIVADLVPPLVLIFLVLGTIFRGIATPTEGGAMGAVGALLLAAANGKLNFSLTRSAAESTARLSAFVLFILLGARVFSLTFYGVNGHIWVEHLLTSVPGGMYGFLIFVNILIFFLAFFLDFFELAFIAVPLLAKAAETIFKTDPASVQLATEYGLLVIGGKEVGDITPLVIWFGVLLGVNMQTSFMHPPFGFALFYLRSVAPVKAYKDVVTGAEIQPVTSGQIYWGAVPFVFIQVAMVALLLFWPGIVLNQIVSGKQVDASKVTIEVPGGLGGLGGLEGDNGLGGLPAGGPSLDMSQPPKVQ